MLKCSHSKDFGGGGTSFKLLQRVSGFTKFLKTIKGESKKAFTLAEVLITLGIIGVVAALTIPNVTSLYRKKVVEGRLVKFYSAMNQAIKLSEVENGAVMQWDVLTSGYDSDDESETDYKKSYTYSWFMKYLAPYLRTLEIRTTYQTNGAILLFFPDGSVCLFGCDSVTFWPLATDYKTMENEDGTITFNREYSGTKYFTFFFYPNYGSGGVFPYGQPNDLTLNTIKTNSSFGCKAELPKNGRAYCTMLIQMNGWKIPDDYPLKF